MFEKLTIKIKRKIYRHRARNIAAEQFELEKLPEVVEWLNTHMKYRWLFLEGKVAQRYWKSLDANTQSYTDECTRFHFLRKKDAAYFKLKWQ